jgi:hypothetical protein
VISAAVSAYYPGLAAAAPPPLRVEIVKRPGDSSGFIILLRRWIVERTFLWFGRTTSGKEHENLADTLAALITLACIQSPSDGLRERRLLSQALRPPEHRQ